HCHFRGLLRLHSRYGPPDRSAAQRRPLSRGSSPSGYPAEPLVSFRINRQLSGWNLPPLMIRAFGAHRQVRTLSVGEVAVGGLRISYHGTQRPVADNEGRPVYGGFRSRVRARRLGGSRCTPNVARGARGGGGGKTIR